MNKQEQLKQAYQSADAIVGLEGWTPTPDALAIQERVIRGGLTHNEAVQAQIESARNAHAKRGQ